MARLARVLLTLLALTLTTVLPSSSFPVMGQLGVAQAANPMVELVSGGDVIGDGTTAVKLHVVAFNPNGTAMSGASLRLSAQAGKAGKVSMVSPGLYTVDWTPPAVEAVSDVRLTLRGQDSGQNRRG